ncbi:bifunctional adenosylcobinamide kinase/adenosylcobinamide-phosphate guanylyltransferase [Methylocystis sp.]|uniref:bifunctional adenosylcobinamide kinase/adenosylcobinamide-phosphate guanylyltransferase n=1 Tax=Methylocystis sp. TaxID=1911079 RepID=UPI003DA2DCDD
MSENPYLTLVLGGARSGKSAYAESLIVTHPSPWTYIATAEILDEEMRGRVDAHRARRGEEWRTVEAAQALVEAVREAPVDGPLLIDCLTLWLSNRLLGGADLSRDRAALVHALSFRSAPTVAVSSEVGLSIVPDNALARSFRDAAGELHQSVSRIAGRVALVVAGNPLIVKGQPSV